MNNTRAIDANNYLDGIDTYRNINRRRNFVLLVVSIILVLGVIADLLIGPSWMTLYEVMKGLFKVEVGSGINVPIVWSIRLPMTLTCLCVGGALGLAGIQMQTILGNPLASPYTLGISSAASFGASIAILTGISIPALPWFSTTLMAFIFSFLATLGIYFMGKMRGMKSTTMILSGIVIHFLFQALQSIIQYIASPEVAQEILFWMFGSLTKATWTGVTVGSIIIVIAMIILAKSVWQITALTTGEERARCLGIDTDKLKLKIFLVSALLTSGAVSFVGTIGFVGLVAPHFAKMCVGEDHRYLSPLSAIFGAVLLTFASIVAKVIRPGTIIPIGIVTSLIGVPFLLYLILKRR